MILFADSEENLWKLITKGNNYYDFANIKLNQNKWEVMAINPDKNDQGFLMNEVR
jgi:hypothetical protein